MKRLRVDVKYRQEALPAAPTSSRAKALGTKLPAAHKPTQPYRPISLVTKQLTKDYSGYTPRPRLSRLPRLPPPPPAIYINTPQLLNSNS